MGGSVADFPELSLEFDLEKNLPVTPQEVAAGSNKKYWWLCKFGHSWQAVVASRTMRGSGCPFCSGRKAIPGQNDLATKFPSLVAEWSSRNAYPPTVQLPFTSKKVWWKGRCGHEFLMDVVGRTKHGQGCPYCSNHRVLAGFNDLASQRPDVASEWHPEKNLHTPEEVTWGSNKKAWFRCIQGHEWRASINSRTSNGTGCPFCAGNRVIPGETDLRTTHPDIAGSWDMQRNTLDASEFSIGSTAKAWWTCEQGHSWEAAIYSRRVSGCPFCAGKKVQSGFNDLESQRPDFLHRWDYELNAEKPSSVSMNSHRRYWWKCSEGHSYLASVSSEKRGRACGVCASKQLLKGFNDLASQRPDLVKEWSSKNGNLRPDDVFVGTPEKAWWVCPLGHEYHSVIASRAKGIGCPVCDNKTVLAGFNDLASQRPDLVQRWHPDKNSIQPNEITVGSVKKVWWLCPEGHEWKSTPANQASGHDCPECGRFGYRSSLPGVFYLLDSFQTGAGKVGITNSDTRNSRIGMLSRMLGFVVVQTWEHQDGEVIRGLENETLRFIRKELKLEPYLAKQDMRQLGGWRETFSRDAIELFGLVDWIEERFRSLTKTE